MNYEQIILDIITPLVANKDRLKVVLMDQENLYETSYVVYCSIQFLSYRLICSGTLTHSGLNIFDYTNKDGVLKTVNLCTLGEGGFAFNLIGLIIFVVGILILRSQGVVCNVKNKLIDDKKNAELNRINTENFTVEEAGSDDESSEK